MEQRETVIDGEDELIPIGGAVPGSFVLIAKVLLFVVFFYGLGSLLGLWGD